jgi:hypothetical protein
MSLMAGIASFHPRTIGPGRKGIVPDIAMAIYAQDFLFQMLLMGDLHNAHSFQVGSLSFRNRRVAVQAVVVHQVITGGILVGENRSGR